ncbi:MAG: hypothetical protein GXP44_00065 [bacterium]|nr:hypothetical protein [bacterium]
MITLIITSPTETAVYENALSVSLPAFFGRMQILPGHAESFISLKKGDIVVKQSNSSEDKIIQIAGGECHIKGDRAAVIL